MNMHQLPFILLLLLTTSYRATSKCPDACDICIHDHISCTGGGLKTIPRNIFDETKKMTFIGHTFSNTVLSRSNFSVFANPKYIIKQLSIRKSNIDLIKPNTFYDLGSLDNLDLSDNRKIVIDYMGFANLKLKHLRLDDIETLILKKDSFKDLMVTTLSIKNSRLKTLDFNIMRPIAPELRSLFLNLNNLTYLEPKFKSLFLNLLHLELNNNALVCNCNLAWLGKVLRERFRKHKIVDDTFSTQSNNRYPQCSGPIHVANKYIHNISEGDFSCAPPTLELIDIRFEKPDQVKLTCSAKLAAKRAPMDIFWQQISHQNVISNSNFQSSANNRAITIVKKNSEIESYRCMAKSTNGNATIRITINWPVDKINESKAIDTNVSGSIVKTKSSHFFFREQFTLLEMLGAVMGTFTITLTAFLLMYKFCFKPNIDKSQKTVSSKKPNYIVYETPVYSDSQTYDVPQNNNYAPNYQHQTLLNKSVPVNTPTHFLDYRTQQKISQH